MILKKLTLLGFKSFPDKTEFEFGEGVTCVVGPNGCGKSNVVDAVKWVLGEQSAKSLRGNQMQDMIFNGSSTRRSSGMAQVDLLFDNLDHTLDLENSEVTISRRLYRSGESEYLLNQQPCRLKDIRELFLDTGVGVDAYSVIEQGRVDSLLQSNPAERRVIFEEAAGISKYKAQRKETERKLERAWQNLLRVSDIIEELEKQLRSVKLQAGKARRFQEYDLRLRELRAAHAMVEYHRLSEAHESCVSHIAESSDQTAGIRAQLSRQEMEQSNLAARALELDRDVDESNQTATELHSRSTALAERVQSAEQHREEHRGVLESLEKRGEQETARLAEIKIHLQQEQDKLPQLLADQQEHAQALDQLNHNDAELAGEIASIQATLEDEQSGLLDLLRQSSELHNKITQLDVHRESLSTQKNRLQVRGGEVRELMEEALQRKAEAAARLANIDRLIEEQQQRLREKNAAGSQLRQARERTAHDLSELAAQRSGLFSRQELLQDLEQRMEGVDRPIRELLHRKSADPDNPRFKAIHGLLADVITTDSRHAPVIEAALERWTQYLVVDDTAAFLALNGDIEALPGRLHVLCLDRLSPIVEGRDFSETPGYVCTAIELVKFPEQLEYLTRSLLGRTIIVESFEHALAMARESVQGYEFVTLKGELVDSRGWLSIGPRSERAGLISRKSVLRQLSEEVVAVDSEQNHLREQLAKQDAELQHLEEVIGGLTEAVSSCLADRSEVQAKLRVAQEEVARLTREEPLIAGEVEMIEREITTAMEHASAKKESLGELEKLNDHRQSETDSCQQRIAEITAKRAIEAKAMTQARVAAGRLAEKITAQQEAIYGIKSSYEAITEALENQQAQIADCSRRIAETTQTIDGASEQLQDLGAQLARHEAETLRLRHERESLRAATEELSENAKSSRAQLSEAEGQLHSEQLKLQEIVVRRDDLEARVHDELGIDLTTAYQASEQEQSCDTVSAEIDELRQKISRLGNINLDAIEQQTHIEGRLDFLVSQRKDLEDSRKQMQDLIDRLNRESRDRFESSFEEIRMHFQQMFRKLFGGGKADLILDPTCEDVLEAGIEILVRPPGKELQSISLLSGGEKALTAIALLLSIFKTKPSPFVILDEVDAALDEANNERFNRIVTEFLKDSQFIIITHSKSTMSIASQLYGVTMQEPGVSRRVSVRFEDHHATHEESPESAVA